MKTKFDSIVKVKAQEVDNIERNIQKINSSINELNKKIEKLQKDILSLHIPKNGTFSIIKQIQTQKSFIQQEIENLKNQIVILNNRKQELLNELKKANIEYEKMKYLQAEEIKKIIKNKKLKELRDMDEIAIILKNSKKEIK